MKTAVQMVLTCLVALLSACASLQTDARKGETRAGNILLIIADDVGNDKVGVYGEGDDVTRPLTPNIDALAFDGVRFTSAYSNPMCSPTRATLLTGRYSFRTGIGHILQHTQQAYGLQPEEISIPELLDMADSGYDHSQVGKWHLSTALTGGASGPLLQGFNWSAGCPSNFTNKCDCDYWWWEKQTNGQLAWTDIYATTDTTDDAIERANSMREPWFLWVSYNAPHGPLHHAPDELHSRPDSEGDDVSMYGTMVEAMDTEIGRLLGSMESATLENTTIIFLGDNGSPPKATVPPFRSFWSKGTLGEGGINVPFIVAGHGVPAGSRGLVSDALVNTSDVYATVADLASVDVEEVLPPKLVLDSVSMIPLLEDPEQAVIRDYVYAERFSPNGLGPHKKGGQAITDGRWKLIRSYLVNRPQPFRDRFYDLDRASPGTDGRNLCPCPQNLNEEALDAYNLLVETMSDLTGS